MAKNSLDSSSPATPNDLPLEGLGISIVQRGDLDESIFDSIIGQLAVAKSCTREFASEAVYSLFLKGAAAKNASDNLTVTVNKPFSDSNGIGFQTISISKGELLIAYKTHTNNSYLRRLAEFAASRISLFAEKNGLSGDLASQLNTKSLILKSQPLTARQKAWANSFNKNNVDLELAPDTIELLVYLAKESEYSDTNAAKQKAKVSKPSPKRQNPPKNTPKSSSNSTNNVHNNNKGKKQ